MSKTIGTTVRMQPQLKDALIKLAKERNQSQGSVIESLLAKEISMDYVPRKAIKTAQTLEKGGVVGEITESEIQMLKEFGVMTGAGIAGYYLSGYIRNQMELDEDKGTQMLFGFLAGLLGLLSVQKRN